MSWGDCCVCMHMAQASSLLAGLHTACARSTSGHAPDITRAATTPPLLGPAQAPTMSTPSVDQADVISQSVMPGQQSHKSDL